MTDSSTPSSPPAPEEHVGQRLAAARLLRGLAQTEVARRADLAPAYLSRLENGKLQPAFRTVVRITRVLGAELDEIVGPSGPGGAPRGPCPVTSRGSCLLDLVALEADADHFTPHQIRLLRRFASWVQTAPPDRLKAMEVLLGDLRSAAAPPAEP